MVRFRCLILTIAAVALPATLLNAALPEPSEAPEHGSLAGQLLVAAPAMRDPRFDHAVILVVKHNSGGALGIIINRPIGERPLARLLQAIGEQDTGVTDSVHIFAGGPVEPQKGFVVHSAEYRLPETLDIDGHVAMTSTPEILRDIGHKRGPSKSLLAFGYSGWGPAQLEDELARHAWFTVPEDPKLIFDEDRDGVWDDAMARRTQPL